MSQEELYELASKLDERDIVYLASSVLEHLKVMEMGGTIDCDDRIFEVHIECKMKSII